MSLPDCKLCREYGGTPSCELLDLRMKSGNLNCTNFKPKVMARPNLKKINLNPKTFMGLKPWELTKVWLIGLIIVAAAIVLFNVIYAFWPEGY